MTSGPVDGVVLNLNAYGAIVRLDGGTLASAPLDDVAAHRALYARSLERRSQLRFELRQRGRRAVVALAPQIHDDRLDAQIADFERTCEGWEPDPGPPAHERHAARKRARAKIVAARRNPRA